jgi:uncharacterized protein
MIIFDYFSITKLFSFLLTYILKNKKETNFTRQEYLQRNTKLLIKNNEQSKNNNSELLINPITIKHKKVKKYPKQVLIFQNYECKKCKNKQYKNGEVREVSGFVSKILKLQNRFFQTTTCTLCGFTEHFERETNQFGDLLDFVLR